MNGQRAVVRNGTGRKVFRQVALRDNQITGVSNRGVAVSSRIRHGHSAQDDGGTRRNRKNSWRYCVGNRQQIRARPEYGYIVVNVYYAVYEIDYLRRVIECREIYSIAGGGNPDRVS